MVVLLILFSLLLALTYPNLYNAHSSRCIQCNAWFRSAIQRRERKRSNMVRSEMSTFLARFVRCGADDNVREEVINPAEEALDTRVYAAMKKLGLVEEGIGAMRGENDGEILDESKDVDGEKEGSSSMDEDGTVADQILKEFNTTSGKSVTKNMVLAALAASGGNASLAREIIQYEIQLVGTEPTSEESQEGLQILLAEGKYEKTRIQRALTLTDNDVPNARAILDAELDDEAIEADNYVEQNEAMPTVNIPANFDPTTLHSFMPTSSSPSNTEKTTSRDAATDAMQFVVNATSDNIQRLVLESPVPVLLDVYANWCGPCKALAPILEELATKTKLFRLAKLNSDEEQAICTLLGVTALPTVFGLRKGQIINSFRGMPKSQEELQNFILALYDTNNGPTSSSYQEMSLKLAKVAGSSAYPFHIRERMAYRITHYLNELLQVEQKTTAIDTAELLHKVIINIINHPFDAKYRKINLYNRIFAEKVTPFPSAIKVLEIIGFHSYIDDAEKSSSDGNNDKMYLLFGQSHQEVINTVPLAIGRDAIGKWLEKHRGSGIAPYTSSKIVQTKRSDDTSHTTISHQEEISDLTPGQVSIGSTSTTASTTTLIKYRFEGKNKVHEAHVSVQTSLKDFIHSCCLDDAEMSDKLDDVQITCIAKRLIVKLSDQNGSMDKSFYELGLYPSAQLVVKLVSVEDTEKTSNSNNNIKERAVKRKKKRGSHTMQSVGIYAKDDNNKAELIDGGGGVWYEHDVSDDELEKHTEDCNHNSTSTDENNDSADSDVSEG